MPCGSSRVASERIQLLQALGGAQHRIFHFARARRIVLAAPGMNEQTGGEPPGDQLEQHLDFGARQGLNARVAGEDLRDLRVSRGTFGEEFRHCHRRFEHPRRVDHVPEVEYAHARASRRIQQQIARMAVTMDGLRAQPAQRSQPGRQVGDGATHQRATGIAIEVIGKLKQCRRLAHVPGDALSQGDVKEARQRVIEARETPANGVECARIGWTTGGEFARQVSNQANLIGDACDHTATKGTAAAGLNNPRHWQIGCLLGEVTQYGGLAVEDRGVGGRIDHLEHVFAPIGGIETEIAVTLAGQEARLGADAIDFQREALGVRRCDLRWISLECDQSLERHVPTPQLRPARHT